MQSRRTALTALILGTSVLLPSSSLMTSAQDATTPTTYTCEDFMQGSGTPAAMMGDMPMGNTATMGTPMVVEDHMTMEFDQMYIDMMIPHHQSIMAMAQASLPRLTDERLQEIAQAIIDTQGPEIEELHAYRETFYGDPTPMPMNQGMMEAMDQMMPGMMDMLDMMGMMDTMPGMADVMAGMMEEMPGMTQEMAGMAMMMNPEVQVAAFCAAENADLAFIDLTIAHHQMAITSSEAALEQATHDEIRDVAQRVIAAQQREIDELTAIRQDLTGEATPAS